MKTFKLKDCDGHVAVIVALVLTVLVAVVGLAIDSGRAYSVKAKLNAAVDAAAIAAARSISEGSDEARQAALAFFSANYPDDYLRSPPEFDLNDIVIAYFPTGKATITVTASAEMPTTFMRILGYDTLDVNASAQVTRKAVDLAFVVDNTTSLMHGDLGDVTGDVKARSIEFVDMFSENFDRLALIKYAFGAEVPVHFRMDDPAAPPYMLNCPIENCRGFDKNSESDGDGTYVNQAINAFQFRTSGNNHYTNCAEGFWRALKELNEIPEGYQSSFRIIVFFTDGSTNTFSSNFGFEYSIPDHKGSIRTGPSTSGTPLGLWEHEYVYQTSPSTWNWRDTYGTTISQVLSGFPQYYNAWDTGSYQFPIINPSHPRRPVSDYSPGSGNQQLWRKVHRISRNLVEDMAKAARQDGIYVYTLGLGSSLQVQEGPDYEVGEDLLLRMANDPRADTYNSDHSQETEGIYCHAVDEDALRPCFEIIAQSIIRLTM